MHASPSSAPIVPMARSIEEGGRASTMPSYGIVDVDVGLADGLGAPGRARHSDRARHGWGASVLGSAKAVGAGVLLFTVGAAVGVLASGANPPNALAQVRARDRRTPTTANVERRASSRSTAPRARREPEANQRRSIARASRDPAWPAPCRRRRAAREMFFPALRRASSPGARPPPRRPSRRD